MDHLIKSDIRVRPIDITEQFFIPRIQRGNDQIGLTQRRPDFRHKKQRSIGQDGYGNFCDIIDLIDKIANV